MRAATIFAIISGASALSIRAECPAESGSPCGIVNALGQTFTYPKCHCHTTCSGLVPVAGINATVSIGKCLIQELEINNSPLINNPEPPEYLPKLDRNGSVIKTFVAPRIRLPRDST